MQRPALLLGLVLPAAAARGQRVASHGYGPVLIAGAETITFRKGRGTEANINDGSVQFAPSPSRY